MKGIMQRKDSNEILKNIPMGCLMGGSGCAIACSICLQNNLPYELSNSILYCLKGYCKPKDLIKCNVDGNIYYGNCQLFWGIASNIVLGGNRFRWLGKLRFVLQALIEIIYKELDEGELSYCPDNVEYDKLPELNEPVPSNWITVKGNFLGNIIVTSSNFNQEMKINRHMDFDTGKICILYAKDITRFQELNLFLSILDQKAEVSNFLKYGEEVCNVIYTKAFRLKHKGSNLLIDGELYKGDGVVQCEILEGKQNWITF